MSRSMKSQGYRLTKKPVVSIAAYTDGTYALLTDGDKTDPTRVLLHEVAPVQPAFRVSVQIGDKVFLLGYDWPHDPKPVDYWDKLAAMRAREHYESRERQLQTEKQRKAAEAGRTRLLKATPREDPDFNFAMERDAFVTANKRVALKALNRGAKFLDVVRDALGADWYRFADEHGTVRDGLCPSCGGEDVRAIPQGGVAYRVCYATGCNFRWLKELPTECPGCHSRKMVVTTDGNDALLTCDNRVTCFFERKLGHLPRIPLSGDDAYVIAVGARDLEQEEPVEV